MEPELKLLKAEPSRETSTTNSANSGAAMMRQAADEVLRDRCMDIAFALANSSIDGHIQSSKFLYELADENQKLGPVEIVQQFHSVATDFANEPEWTGDPSEESLEEAVGSVEPKF
jgi:hypothetical protein